MTQDFERASGDLILNEVQLSREALGHRHLTYLTLISAYSSDIPILSFILSAPPPNFKKL